MSQTINVSEYKFCHYLDNSTKRPKKSRRVMENYLDGQCIEMVQHDMVELRQCCIILQSKHMQTMISIIGTYNYNK